MSLTMLYGSHQCLFDGPIQLVHSLPQYLRRYIQLSCPLTDSQFFALKLKDVVAALVVCLLNISSPVAVVGRISQIIVDTVNCEALIRTGSHISQECLEAVTPFVAHGYSARAIILIRWRIWIVTTSLDIRPYAIFSSFSEAMRAAYPGGYLIVKASTTQSATIKEHDACNRLARATFAATKPDCPIEVIRAHIAKHGKATEHLAGQVFDLSACDRDDFWGMILHVSLLNGLTTAGTLARRLPLFIGLLPLHYSTFSRVMEGGA